MVAVAAFVPVIATGLGVMEQFVSAGAPLQASETLPVNPPLGVTVMV